MIRLYVVVPGSHGGFCTGSVSPPLACVCASKEIDVRVENNVLMLKGTRKFENETKEENYYRVEREYGSFSRSFALPTGVKEDKVTAEYKDGILKIVLPKKEEVKPKSIKIEAA